jgi:acetyltransferase-like isoleucine patch superfamily enzyme
VVTTLLCCAGAHASDIIEIANRAGIRLNCHDDADSPARAMIVSDLIIGINNPITRREIAERYGRLPAAPPLVDRSAIIGEDVIMAGGVVVGQLASIGHGSTLGEHAHVNARVSMVRCGVGPYTTISPGVTICGDVEIGEASWIGAGAVVCDRVTIGHECVIAAGAIIPPESVVPNGAKVIGVFK